jgi:hypothetical protein
MKALTALGLVLATALVSGCSDKGLAETTASDRQDIIIGVLRTVSVSLDSSRSSASLSLADRDQSTNLGVFQGALAYSYRCISHTCWGNLGNAGFVLDDFTTTLNFTNAAGISMTAQVMFQNPRVDILGNPGMSYSSLNGWDVPAGTPVGFSAVVSGCFFDASGACSITIPLTFEAGTGTLTDALYISAGPSPSIQGTFPFQLSASASLAGVPVTLNVGATVGILAHGS